MVPRACLTGPTVMPMHAFSLNDAGDGSSGVREQSAGGRGMDGTGSASGPGCQAISSGKRSRGVVVGPSGNALDIVPVGVAAAVSRKVKDMVKREGLR